MADMRISELTTAAGLHDGDLFETSQTDSISSSGYASYKTSLSAIAAFIAKQVQFSDDLQTTSKNLIGAINEVFNAGTSVTVTNVLPATETTKRVATITVDGVAKDINADDTVKVITDLKTPKNATITNGIAQFECIEENLVKGLKVTMNPIQSGSGDPSPTNIRPISGRTEVSVKRTGKNLFDFSNTDTTNGYVENKWLNSNGNEMNYGNWNIGVYTRIFPNTQYTISGMTDSAQVSDGRGGYCFYDDSKTYISGGKYNSINQVVLTPNNAKYIRVSFLSYSYSSEYPQLELGSTATAYEPYNAETHTKEFGQTVYGGTLDVKRGVLTVTMASVDLGTLNYTLSTELHPRFNTDSLPNIKAPTTVGDLLNGVCEAFDIKTAAETYFGVIGLSANENGQLRIYAPTYSNVEAFKTAMSGVQLCYELATPTTISTSAEEITTVEGTNIISGTEPISECQYTELATVDDLRKIIGGQ